MPLKMCDRFIDVRSKDQLLPYLRRIKPKTRKAARKELSTLRYPHSWSAGDKEAVIESIVIAYFIEYQDGIAERVIAKLNGRLKRLNAQTAKRQSRIKRCQELIAKNRKLVAAEKKELARHRDRILDCQAAIASWESVIAERHPRI